MPNKHNEARHHHIAKKSMKVMSRAEYNAGLRRRGSLTLWISEHAMAALRASARLTRVGIEAGLRSSSWAPEFACSIAGNDPAMSIAWPMQDEPILSAKDLLGKPVTNAEHFA